MKTRNRFSRNALLPAFVALGALAGCTGQISQPGFGTGSPVGSSGTMGASASSGVAGTGSASSTGAGVATTGNAPPTDCTAKHAPVLHARLLTPSQYNNTVSDLVKVVGDLSKGFGGGVGAQLDDLSANAATGLAQQAVLSMAQWSPCMSPPVAAAACEQQIIDKVGSAVYRHPLSAAERMELQALFDAGVKEKDFATGVEWFLGGVFQSPDFLYQLSKPQAGEAAGQLVALPSYELASRLSYFIWDSTPDDALYAAASANDLADATRLQTQLNRMVKDARFQRGITGFYTSWLDLSGFHDVARDDPAFTTDVVSGLQTSLLMSATQLYQGTTAPNIAGLFSGATYYLNGALRTYFGLPGGTGTAFTAADMTSDQRRGILTHPGLMALLARPNQSNPISRGLFIRTSVLCQMVPPPPQGIVIPPLPPVTPGMSTRDRLEQHVTNPVCSGCHSVFDPPGYAFENFDQVGRHRTVDSGKPTDTSGTMTNAGDLTGPFANGAELLGKIAQSQDVKGCFAQKYFEFAVSRLIANEDVCSVDALKKDFAPSGDLLALVVSIANTDSFRFRLSEGGP
jgi:hypothetical protein